jgi:hypothetical protein
MTANVDPDPCLPPRATVSVGIFWLVPDSPRAPVLVTDKEPLAMAEPYGDFLTHPRGHYEVWSDWKHRGARFLRAQGWPLAILTTEYEVFPRGRAVFHIPSNTFWIYADRRLRNGPAIKAITASLGLSDEAFEVKSDEHYR